MVRPLICFNRSQFGCNLEKTLRLCNSWFDGQHIISSSSRDLVEGIITGAIAQRAEKEDAIIVEDLLGRCHHVTVSKCLYI